MAVDPKAPATYPIRLGASILKPNTAEAHRYAALKYNYRLRSKVEAAASVRATIDSDKAVSGEGSAHLWIEADQASYTFAGQQSQNEDTLVLVLRGSDSTDSSKTDQAREIVLERVDRSYRFNVTSTPGQSDAAALAEQYPPLVSSDPDDEDENEDDIFGSDEDAPPSASNPFDYRHFLRAELEKSSHETTNAENSRSAVGTPLAHVNSAAPTTTSTPIALSAATKRNTAKRASALSNAPDKKRNTIPPHAKPSSNSTKSGRGSKTTTKRVKAGAEEASLSSPPHHSNTSDIPSLRLERKASVRVNQDVTPSNIHNNSVEPDPDPMETNGLTYDFDFSNENDDDEPDTNFADQDMDSGELILENAAPAHSASSARPGASAMALALSGQFGSGPISLRSAASSPAANSHIGGSSPTHQRRTDDDDDDNDDDVDDLELPSPAATNTASTRATLAPPPPPPADDDDDLDRQLLRAMEEEAESEESEEE